MLPSQVLTKDEPSQWPKLSTNVQVRMPAIAVPANPRYVQHKALMFSAHCRPKSAMSCWSASGRSRCGQSLRR